MNKDYKCTICGRLFIKPLPHKCIGNFRKHHLRKIFINIKENKDMTREEAIKFLNNTKVYVNGKSGEIQEKLFSFNFKWCDGSQKVKKVNYPFLFLHNGWISYNDDMIFFTKSSYREITAEEILAITIEDEPKYRPFKNANECWNEMLKHQPFGWVEDKEGGKYCITGIIDMVGYNAESTSFTFGWDLALHRLTFVDGTPFGIKEG